MASALQKHKTADLVKWIVIFVISIALIGAVIGLSVKLSRQTSTTTIGGEAYSIGVVQADGKVDKETNTSIYTRNTYTTKSLHVEISDNADVKYELFFYDKDGKYLSSTGALSADYDGKSIPEGAKSFRCVITPTNDDNGVSLLEVLGYAGQVTVTVHK